MGGTHQFRSIEDARRDQHEADARVRAGIGAQLCARDAAVTGACAAGGAAQAAHDLAAGLGGPHHTSTSAVAAERLCEQFSRLAEAIARLGEQFALLADIARADHLVNLRDRFGSVPDDYLRDLFGPDYRPPQVEADPAARHDHDSHHGGN